MNIKKNLLSRIARRKSAARAEPGEGHEIPSPAAIERDLPCPAGNPGDKGLGSHEELELIASGEPAPTGSADRVDAVDNGDAPGPHREAAPYGEYGLELELLSGTEPKALREEAEVIQESEPEAVDDAVAGDGETRTASVLPDSPDEPALAENGVFPLVRDARGVWRLGKGFSRGELREAGLSPADASRLHIRLDKRRGNTHPVNVASLEQAKSGVWWHEPAVKGSNDGRIRIGVEKLSRIRRIRRGK